MGTPDFAVATLKALIDNQYNVVGVITAPDRPAGRGQKLRASAVKKFAVEQQLTIFDGVGFAVEDYSALRYVYDLLSRQGQCEQLELLANPENPRNLYGVVVDQSYNDQ